MKIVVISGRDEVRKITNKGQIAHLIQSNWEWSEKLLFDGHQERVRVAKQKVKGWSISDPRCTIRHELLSKIKSRNGINRGFDNCHNSLLQIELNRKRLAAAFSLFVRHLILIANLFLSHYTALRNVGLPSGGSGMGKRAVARLADVHSMGQRGKIRHFHLRAKHVTNATSCE